MSLLEAARYYQDNRGWQAIPVHQPVAGNTSTGKTAAIKWRNRGPLTQKEINYYFSDHKFNVAIRLDGLLAVDCDTEEALEFAEANFGETGWVQQTGKGGKHYLYRVREPQRNRINVFGIGLDIKTGPGAYLMMPPSIHYSCNAYKLLSHGELGEFDPDWLPKAIAPAAMSRELCPDEQRKHRCRRYLAKMRSIAGEGGDNQLFKAACVAIQKFGLSPDEAIEELRIFNAYNCEPPWPEERLHRKISEASRLNKPTGS